MIHLYTDLKNRRPTNRFWLIVGVITLIFIAFCIGRTGATSVYWEGFM